MANTKTNSLEGLMAKIAKIDAAMQKRAEEPTTETAKDPGLLGGDSSSHETAKTDNGTMPIAKGSKPSDDDKVIKEMQPAGGPKQAPSAPTATDGSTAKSDMIGTVPAGTSEDVKDELATKNKDEGMDGKTTHPASPNTSAEKYGGDYTGLINQMEEVAHNLSLELSSYLEKGASDEKPAASDTEANKAAAAAGFVDADRDLADNDAIKQAFDQYVEDLTAATIGHALYRADLLIDWNRQVNSKQATDDGGEPPLDEEGGGGGEEEAALAALAQGGPPAGGDPSMAGASGPPPGDGGGGGGGEELSPEAIQAILQLLQQIAATGDIPGGAGGGAGGGGGLPPDMVAGGAPPPPADMGGGGAPPMADPLKAAGYALARKETRKAARHIQGVLQEVLQRSRNR